MWKRIIYFSPTAGTQVGGVKVIHRHSEMINNLGGTSEIFHAYGEYPGVRWFEHRAKIKANSQFDPKTDFVMLPESMIFDYWRRLRDLSIEFGIFVQNGYNITKGIDSNDLVNCYKAAKYIVCISEDAIRCVNSFLPGNQQKIIRIISSIDEKIFSASPNKQNIICYMPRKLAIHSDILTTLLSLRLPKHWSLAPIGNMSESQVAEVMSKSKIFLALSDFEGLALPPIEAAFSGNFVIGYTGQGGREYWNPPIFEEIAHGDLVSFLEAIHRKINAIDANTLCFDESFLSLYRQYFSSDMEARLISNMIERICN
jgi:hypothetical protein